MSLTFKDQVEHISMKAEPLKAAAINALDDDAFQAELLEGVSRTFALTIPQLPKGLLKPVANAYLLCRIVDTIEDEIALNSTQKRQFSEQFTKIVAGEAEADTLAKQLSPLLSSQTIPAEHVLIQLMPRVIQITHGFEAPQREALSLCVAIMGKGMVEYQDKDLRHGLATLNEMDEYCYYVAGVVGEMLTRLFCHYSPEIDSHKESMMKLAISFGQGLQMTNILKDLWDDYSREVCWLPRDIFEAQGFNLNDLKPNHHHPNFHAGFKQLIQVAHSHLKNALEYTLLIPSHETGMREFCLWALGMALLTLRKINQNIDFNDSSQVKISRNSVRATVIISRLTRRSDLLLKTAFYLTSLGLPSPRIKH